MLPLRLRQVKKILDDKKASSSLSPEEQELRNELKGLDENDEIQQKLREIRQVEPLTEMIAPAPQKCPACGRNF